MRPEERLVFIDYLRVIACFMVMMVHAAENLYIPYLSGNEENLVTIASDTNRFWIAFWNGGIARTCVPLFMIASAFLLVPVKQGVTMTAFYKRRFLRIIPPTAAFLVLYAVIPPLYGAFSWEQAWTYLKQIPFNFPDNAGHLWFMYPFISLYIIIPIVPLGWKKPLPKTNDCSFSFSRCQHSCPSSTNSCLYVISSENAGGTTTTRCGTARAI